jgi:hypothetical protein
LIIDFQTCGDRREGKDGDGDGDGDDEGGEQEKCTEDEEGEDDRERGNTQSKQDDEQSVDDSVDVAGAMEVEEHDGPVVDGDRNGNSHALISSPSPAAGASPSSLAQIPSSVQIHDVNDTSTPSSTPTKAPEVPQEFIDAYNAVKIPALKSYELYSPDGASSDLIAIYMKILLFLPDDVPERPDMWETTVYKWAELEDAWGAHKIPPEVSIINFIFIS